MMNDGVVAKTIPFVGRFVNETKLPRYTGLTAGTPVMVNNTYPCNIDADILESKGYTILMYNYDKCKFVNTNPSAKDLIKPQHGFVITNNGAAQETLDITQAMLAGGSTKYNDRTTKVTMPYHVLGLYNENSTNGYASEIQVYYDEQKGNNAADVRNTPIFWSNSENSLVPDLYMIMNDQTLQRLYVGEGEVTIPLGIRLQMDMDVTFKMEMTNGYEKAILLDTETGKEYDLTINKEYTVMGLKQGDCLGRFFLNLKAETEYEEDTPTDIEMPSINEPAINMYVVDNQSINILTTNTELQVVYVYDMVGRTIEYQVSGNNANIRLPFTQGVYAIQVICDKLTRTEKVILK
jgi:hypothetical protein